MIDWSISALADCSAHKISADYRCRGSLVNYILARSKELNHRQRQIGERGRSAFLRLSKESSQRLNVWLRRKVVIIKLREQSCLQAQSQELV